MATRSVCLVLLLSGCSLALNGPEPNRPRGQLPACDTSKALVFLDGLDAAALGVGGLASIGNDGGKTAGGFLLATSALFALSAIHGSSVTDGCRKELDVYAGEVGGPRMPGAAPFEDKPAVAATQPTVTQAAVHTLAPQPQQQEPPPAPAISEEPRPAPAPVKARPVEAKPAPKAPGDEWDQFWREVP